MRLFFLPIAIALAVVAGTTIMFGWQLGFITAMLAVMEISLSFDNAVVNAAVLRNMDEKWQRRFLTYGLIIAVSGMRLLLPIIIVSCAAGLGLIETARMALDSQDLFAHYIQSAHIQIDSFGGMFLGMVFLGFLFDAEKDTHWLKFVERYTSKLGGEAIFEVFVALAVLLELQHFLNTEQSLESMLGGLIGLTLFLGVELACDLGFKEGSAAMVRSGIVGFLYLEALDASFSFDGVIGAFAVSHNLIIIMAGLGVGACFIRNLTVFLVRQGVLENYIYLEHGAHWSIGALAAIMLISALHPVPEVVAGLIGVGFIGAAFLSSLLERSRQNSNMNELTQISQKLGFYDDYREDE